MARAENDGFSEREDDSGHRQQVRPTIHLSTSGSPAPSISGGARRQLAIQDFADGSTPEMPIRYYVTAYAHAFPVLSDYSCESGTTFARQGFLQPPVFFPGECM